MADDMINIAPDTGPALSATSDVPVFAEAPPEPAATETADVAPQPTETVEAAAETPAAEDPAGEVGTEEPAGETDPPAEVEAQPQRREDPRTRRAKEQDAALAARDQRIDQLLSVVERLTAANPPPEPERQAAPEVPQAPQKPRREDFTDPDAYDDARDQWAVDQATYQIEAKQRAQAADAASRQQNEARVQQAHAVANAWNERRSAFIQSHPDYEAVAESDDVLITPAMAQIMSAMDNGPEVAYHLGKNIEVANRIIQATTWDGVSVQSGMQALMRAGVELGAISAKLGAAPAPVADQPPPRPVSRAPAPIRPLQGSDAPAGERSPDEMSGDEYFDGRVGHYRRSNNTGVGRVN